MRLSRIVMLGGMILTLSALGFGIELRSMAWEWGMLVLGCVIFYLGWLLEHKQAQG